MAQLEAAYASMDAFRDGLHGHLRLTVPTMALPLVIEPVIPRLRQRHKGITLEVSVTIPRSIWPMATLMPACGSRNWSSAT